MPSTYTPSKNLELVARGEQVGTWDTPENSNWSIVDTSFGGVTSVALTNSNVTLSAGQYQCNFINFTGAISANIAITMPAVGSYYTIQNLTSNTSAFTVTLRTTASGGQVIGIPPGNPTEVFTDGTNVKFRGLPPVPSYMDWGGSSVPAWISACTVPPWLNCDGTSFSSATYPILATVLGGTTLPDSRGRYRLNLNQGQSRVTSSAGVDGNTLLAGGGSMLTLTSSYIPLMSKAAGGMTDDGHLHSFQQIPIVSGGGSWGSQSPANQTVTTPNTGTAFTGITVGTSIPSAIQVPPSYVGGLTLIRAA